MYKLTKKFDYDFNKPTSLGYVIEAKPYRLNDTQNMIHIQGGRVTSPKISLEYIPSQPVRISC